jgi:hypothetical protein
MEAPGLLVSMVFEKFSREVDYFCRAFDTTHLRSLSSKISLHKSPCR